MYKRLLIKLSGEMLAGGHDDKMYDGDHVKGIAESIARVHNAGVEVAIVIGAGNIWRGARQNGLTIDRVRADQMGMLATLINSLAVQDYLIRAGVDTVVMSAVQMSQFCENYSQYKAREYLKDGKVVIISCGVGYPFFTTDTGVMLRAAELEVECVFAAKAVDGVYDKDPKRYPDAVKYDEVTYDLILAKNLTVIDAAAAAIGRDNDIPMFLFKPDHPKNIEKAALGQLPGTLIKKA